MCVAQVAVAARHAVGPRGGRARSTALVARRGSRRAARARAPHSGDSAPQSHVAARNAARGTRTRARARRHAKKHLAQFPRSMYKGAVLPITARSHRLYHRPAPGAATISTSLLYVCLCTRRSPKRILMRNSDRRGSAVRYVARQCNQGRGRTLRSHCVYILPAPRSSDPRSSVHLLPGDASRDLRAPRVRVVKRTRREHVVSI